MFQMRDWIWFRLPYLNVSSPKSGVAKTVGCRSRLVDRNLILYQDHCNMEIEDLEKYSAKIQESTSKELGTFISHFIQRTNTLQNMTP